MSYWLIHWFACFFVVVVVFFGNTFIWLFTEKNSVTGNVSRFDVSPASLSASVSRFMIWYNTNGFSCTHFGVSLACLRLLMHYACIMCLLHNTLPNMSQTEQCHWTLLTPFFHCFYTEMTSQIRQNFHQDCEAAINRQINLELYASYVYLSMVRNTFQLSFPLQYVMCTAQVCLYC